MNQIQNIPLGLDQHEEQKVWRSGVKRMAPIGQTLVAFDTEESAWFFRNKALSSGQFIPVVSSPVAAGFNEVMAIARGQGYKEIQVWDIGGNVVERWAV